MSTCSGKVGVRVPPHCHPWVLGGHAFLPPSFQCWGFLPQDAPRTQVWQPGECQQQCLPCSWQVIVNPRVAMPAAKTFLSSHPVPVLYKAAYASRHAPACPSCVLMKGIHA